MRFRKQLERPGCDARDLQGLLLHTESGTDPAASLEKGSGVPNRDKVGRITPDQVRRIAEQKMPDLNASDMDAAMRIIEGTARSMGVEVGA